MGNPRSSKRDIDRVKRERAELKRQRRLQAGEGGDPAGADDAAGAADGGPMSEQDVLRALDDLHARYEAEQLDFDEFSDAKSALLGRLAGL